MMIHWWQAVLYIFCLVTLIQLFYYLYFFLRLASHKLYTENKLQAQPVSVIICARNEVANLKNNLPGVLTQEYTATHEVIVVNDTSTDESKYLLKDYQNTFRHLQVLEVTRDAQSVPGKKLPLSIGIKSARHDIIALTDADCVPASENWLKKLQEGYKHDTEIVLGYGAYHKRKGCLNKLVRWETFHTALQYLSYAKAGMAYMGVGRNLSYKKSIWLRHKGFSSHENVISGDDDLFISNAATEDNTTIVINKDAFTLSEPPETWRQWMRQKTRHYSTAKFYKTSQKILLASYSFTQFLFYPLFAAVAFFNNTKIALCIFGIRLFIQSIIFYKTMKKLNEEDLFLWFPVFDLWMFFYYLIFSVSVFKTPSKKWN
jgi:cellulose synthase/poly-beta-1,6-N-acetylglucosamine synthase-like glycosyltransferase